MTHSVLIVDDDRELRSIYRVILERAGYTTHEAPNGVEALKFLADQMPDVIVMDMLMPMMGGEVVMQRIRQMSSPGKVRIVVLTAYPRFRESALFFHADQFLVKPIKPDDLLQAIASVLQEDYDPGQEEDTPGE